ncbi:MAG: hypothetical protein PW734_11445 [Verrucomicrobium sp.]|nr:hypothetical protein [Verrucomicrobium sp.]
MNRRAFSLVEMLAALAAYSVILLLLAQLASQAGKLWKRGADQDACRLRARVMLSYVARELRTAAVPFQKGATNSFQFLVDPPAAGGRGYPDSVFWQAPIATETSAGEMAEVGYFVRWDGGRARLCRFFANPSAPQYLLSSFPAEWLTPGLLAEGAPADAASRYRGLFLENVLGFWVRAYAADGTTPLPNPYDSRNAPDPAHPLPASVELSVAFVDEATAERLRVRKETGQVETLARSAQDLPRFLAALPPWVRQAANGSTLRVSMDNYR